MTLAGEIAAVTITVQLVNFGIPLKPITDSATKPINIQEASDQASERSDAGFSICTGKVIGFVKEKSALDSVRSEAEATTTREDGGARGKRRVPRAALEKASLRIFVMRPTGLFAIAWFQVVYGPEVEPPHCK